MTPAAVPAAEDVRAHGLEDPNPSGTTAKPCALGAEIAPGYRVLALVRRGALLDVYDCSSSLGRCRCVVKIVRPDYAANPHAQQSLLHEGRLLRRLAHPNVVRV